MIWYCRHFPKKKIWPKRWLTAGNNFFKAGMKMRFQDLTGQKFGHLMVLSRAENGKDGGSRYLCICDCGNTKEIRAKHLKLRMSQRPKSAKNIDRSWNRTWRHRNAAIQNLVGNESKVLQQKSDSLSGLRRQRNHSLSRMAS